MRLCTKSHHQSPNWGKIYAEHLGQQAELILPHFLLLFQSIQPGETRCGLLHPLGTGCNSTGSGSWWSWRLWDLLCAGLQQTSASRNQPTSQPTSLPTYQPTHLPTHLPIHQPTNIKQHETTNQVTSHPWSTAPLQEHGGHRHRTETGVVTARHNLKWGYAATPLENVSFLSGNCRNHRSVWVLIFGNTWCKKVNSSN